MSKSLEHLYSSSDFLEAVTENKQRKTQELMNNKTVGTWNRKKDADVLTRIKNLFNTSDIKKTFRIGSSIVDSIVPFIEKPTWWSGGRAVLAIGKIFVEDMETWTYSHFDSDEWVAPFSTAFQWNVVQVLSGFPYHVVKVSDEANHIRMVDLDGRSIGLVFNVKLSSISAIYTKADEVPYIKQRVRQLLWDRFNNQPLTIRNNSNSFTNLDGPRILFDIDDAFAPMPSKKASELAAYMKRRCIDAGVNTSVMFYGPPGTGKSTMARAVIQELNLRSLRIRVEDIPTLGNGTIIEAIDTFQPTAIILDDLDRSHAQDTLLEMMSFLQKKVPLVVATVNNMNNLDEAILRPGRFDELVLVDAMDEDVVKKMLGDYVDGFEFVKAWPIVFINEYVKRRRFMDASETESSMKELAERVERLECYRSQTWRDIQANDKREKAERERVDDEFAELEP